MTVKYLGEIQRKGKNTSGVRTYTRTFRLTTDSRSDGVYTVGSHASLPIIGSAHPDDATSFCVSLSVENTEEWTGWTAVAEYTSDTQGNNTDPLEDEPRVSFSSEIYQEPVWADTDGNAILNSAGDYFVDPVPTRDFNHLIAKIRSNVEVVPVWALNYQNAVNDGPITIGGLAIGQGLAKVQRLDIGEAEVRNDVTFFPVNLEIHIHKDGWKLRPLDCGFRYDDNGTLKNIKTDGEDITQPAPLDGSGGVLENPTTATAVFGEFAIYEELDFTQLPGVS